MEELKPIYNKSLSSFCGQALINKSNGITELVSFGKKVGEIKGNKVRLFKTNIQSRAQIVHIIEWLKQNHFEIGTKKWMLEKYGGD